MFCILHKHPLSKIIFSCNFLTYHCFILTLDNLNKKLEKCQVLLDIYQTCEKCQKVILWQYISIKNKMTKCFFYKTLNKFFYFTESFGS